MRGGKRKGAGRPPGSTKENNKQTYTTRLAPDLIKLLRANELPAAKIIDRALREWFKR